MKTNFTLSAVKQSIFTALFISFSILANAQTSAMIKLHEEKYPSYFNTGFATTINTTFASSSGTWSAWSNNEKATITVVDYAAYSAPCAVKVVNYSTCGFASTAITRATAPVTNLAAYASSQKVEMDFYVFSYENISHNATEVAIEFYNGSNWVKQWAKSGTQFNNEIGMNNWKKYTLNIPPAFRRNDFRYRIVGTMPGNICGNQYVYFDNFTISASLATLPTDVSLFARENNGVNEIEWINHNEGGNTVYNVERSADGRNFAAIGNVNPVNASGSQTYRFSDYSPLPGMNYYRLAIKTRNGETVYSEIKAVAGRGKTNPASLYPNPAATFTHVSVPAEWQRQPLQIQVFGADGRLLISQRHQSASATEVVNVQSLGAGIYRMTVSNNAGGEQQTLSFIKN